MSNEELSDAELINLLGTYGDALEAHESIAPSPDGVGAIANQQSSDTPQSDTAQVSSAHVKGPQTVENEHIRNNEGEGDVIEVDVVPSPAPDRGRSRVLVGAIAVAVVALVGAVFVINQDSTELDTAQTVEEVDDMADETDPPADEASGDGDVTDTAQATDSILAEGVSDDMATEAVADFGFSGPNNVVFADGEFVRLGAGTVLRSSNGTDWTEEAVSGLPENASPMGLVEVDGRLATLLEVWPTEDELDETQMFGPGPQPERLIAVSDDLINWTTSEFPEVDVPENGYAYVSGLAASGDRIAVSVQVEPGGPDEMRILFEAGLLTQADLENFCGTELREGEAFIVYSCEGMEVEAMELEVPGFDDDTVPTPTTVAPRGPAEEELLRIEAGDPVYNQLIEAREFNPEEGRTPAKVASGPVGGPLEIVELPLTGFGVGLAGTDAGFVAMSSGFDSGGAVTSSSADGVTWSAPRPVGTDVNVESIATSNERIAVTGHDPSTGALIVLTSGDLGATWTEADLASELFSSWGQPIGGPAGFVVRLEGSTEPFDDAANSPFDEDAELSVEKDGYTMTIGLASGEATLTGPDGEIIHENIREDVLGEGGAENVVRFEGRYESTIVWLDPVTGEDLVAFEEGDMEAAFAEVEPQFSGVEYEEPEQGSEMWFSADGTTWTLLSSENSNSGVESYTTVAGVGDDEVLVRVEEFNEPPAELLEFDLEGREPTEEEIEAIDTWYADRGNGVTWKAIPVG